MMNTDNLVTFTEVRFTDHNGQTHDGIRAQIMDTDLTDNDTIVWVMDLLNGCSLLRPRDVVIVDFHHVHRISVSFWTQFLQLRQRVCARGGYLRVYRLNHNGKSLLATLLSKRESPPNGRMLHASA